MGYRYSADVKQTELNFRDCLLRMTLDANKHEKGRFNKGEIGKV